MSTLLLLALVVFIAAVVLGVAVHPLFFLILLVALALLWQNSRAGGEL